MATASRSRKIKKTAAASPPKAGKGEPKTTGKPKGRGNTQPQRSPASKSRNPSRAAAAKEAKAQECAEKTPAKSRKSAKKASEAFDGEKGYKSEKVHRTRTRFYSERVLETSTKSRTNSKKLEKDIDIWLNLSGVEILAAISKGILNWKEIQFTDDVLKAMRIC